MTRILVTGATGFVGRRLVSRLRDAFPQAELIAAGGHLGEAGTLERVKAISGSLLDDAHVADLAATDPDLVIHLAARSSVAGSLQSGRETMQVNLGGTMKLAEALSARTNLKAFVFASSAEVYGRSFNDGMVNEDSPMRPANAYARSKAAGEWALTDVLGDVCRVYLLRLFNHSGPGQDGRFVIPAFAAQIARAETGQAEPVVRVGNLSAKRDFLHIDDIMSAYVAVANHALEQPAGVTTLNIASGRATSIQSILDSLVERAQVDLRVETDPERLRPSEVPVAAGDPARAHNTIGWQATIPMDRLLEDVLQYWRTREG